jgi:hypothetical protein
MSRLTLPHLLLIVTAHVAAGNDPRADAKTPAPAGKEARLTAAEAEQAIRTHLRAEDPALNPAAALPVREMTTPAVWDRLGAQVFKVTGELRQNETFVVRAGRVHRIGKAFGGEGVTSLCVADLDRDGRPELVYAFAWGSGVPRAEVGRLNCLADRPREQVATPAYFFAGPLDVERADEHTVHVRAGQLVVGRLAAEGKGERASLLIRLDAGLPADVRDRFKGK